MLEKLKQRPDESDSQFQDRRGALAADAPFALGMVDSQQEQFEEALAEYKLAISSTSKPTFQYYYRMAEAYASVGQVPQAIDVLQKASELARGTPMQKYADNSWRNSVRRRNNRVAQILRKVQISVISTERV